MSDELPPGEVGECPFCGEMLILDDAAKMTHHASPVCVAFRLVVASGGGRPAGPSPACYVCRRDDVELRLYGKDGQPICFPCMKGDPEREREAHSRMAEAMGVAGDLPVVIPGVGIISMEEAESRGLADKIAIVDTATGQVLPRGGKA